VPSAAVVGGGMAGVALALRLSAAGRAVTLYEAAPALGGLASAWQIDVPGEAPLVWDRHYHVTLTSDAATRRVLDELGLDLHGGVARTGYPSGHGPVVPANTPIEFLKLPGLSPVAKLRIGGTMWLGSRIRDGRKMERVLVDDWLRRWSGRRGYERFWLPLLRAKLGENHRVASAAFIWATIARLYRARRAGVAQDEFGWVEGGYATTLARAAEVLTERGVEVRTGVKVDEVRPAGGGVGVGAPAEQRGVEVVVGGVPTCYDQVVVTAAAPVAARLCAGLADDERRRLEGVTYQGIVCASLVLRRPITDDYLTYITDLDCPFTAVVSMSALTGTEALGGRQLVYLPKYVTTDDPLLDADDEAVRAAFLPYLARLLPAFDPDDVLGFAVSRARYVLAVTTLRYSDHVPPTRTSVPGLWLASSANIVHGTLNVDETVTLAEAVADDMLAVEVPVGS
jgi:protoporphyrinogen oxidase